MEGTSPVPYPAPSLDRNDVHVSERVNFRPGVDFAIVTADEADDPISQSLAAGAFPESYWPLVELLEALTPKGGRVLDMGTHVGTFLLTAAALGFEVLGIEASPRNASLLQASIDRNTFTRARLMHAAVSDGPGTLTFLQAGPYGHVVEAGSENAGRHGLVEVPAPAVDDLLDGLGWDHVDFIKMDIEGSEVTGLRGLSRRLTRSDAPPLIVESNGHTLAMFGQTTKRLRRALEDFGYRLNLVEDGCLRAVKSNELQPETCVDPRMDRAELSRRVLASSGSKSIHNRMHIARELAGGGWAVPATYEVREAVRQLKADAEPSVREAAATLTAPPAWRTWLGL